MNLQCLEKNYSSYQMMFLIKDFPKRKINIFPSLRETIKHKEIMRWNNTTQGNTTEKRNVIQDLTHPTKTSQIVG
jgi:hypothetical protein